VKDAFVLNPPKPNQIVATVERIFPRTYAGLPVNQAMGIHYQVKGRQANGLLVDGTNVEIVAAYSRDRDRNIGAGTFTTKLGATKILYHRVPELHPVLQQRFLANALAWLTT
jgi:beta-galactosidase